MMALREECREDVRKRMKTLVVTPVPFLSLLFPRSHTSNHSPHLHFLLSFTSNPFSPLHSFHLFLFPPLLHSSIPFTQGFLLFHTKPFPSSPFPFLISVSSFSHPLNPVSHLHSLPPSLLPPVSHSIFLSFISLLSSISHSKPFPSSPFIHVTQSIPLSFPFPSLPRTLNPFPISPLHLPNPPHPWTGPTTLSLGQPMNMSKVKPALTTRVMKTL